MKIKMTSIPVPNPSAAFKHYTEVLGFQELLFDPEAQLAIVVSPHDPQGTSLMLEPNSNPISKNYQTALYDQRIPIMTFSTENLKEEYVRLINLDVKFLKEPTQEDWGQEAIFDDNHGNYIQLIQEDS